MSPGTGFPSLSLVFSSGIGWAGADRVTRSDHCFSRSVLTYSTTESRLGFGFRSHPAGAWNETPAVFPSKTSPSNGAGASAAGAAAGIAGVATGSLTPGRGAGGASTANAAMAGQQPANNDAPIAKRRGNRESRGDC